MSFDKLPDEVLEKILNLALVSEGSIATSTRAHNIYQTFLDSTKVIKERPSILQEDYLETHPPKFPARSKLIVSPLPLGTCRRWYRLGGPVFYGSNAFVTMHRDLGTFAKQITYHNSQLLRSVELVVRHDDPDPAPKISWLRKAYLGQVENVNVIIAKRHRIVKRGLDKTQRAIWWLEFELMMKKKTTLLWHTMEKQKQQGGHWKIVDHAVSISVDAKAEIGIFSWVCTLKKRPMPPKTLAHSRAVDVANEMQLEQEEDAALSEVVIPDGSVASEETSTDAEAEAEADAGKIAAPDAATPRQCRVQLPHQSHCQHESHR